MNDPYRDKTVQLLDDFKISGVNGTRILDCTVHNADTIVCNCIELLLVFTVYFVFYIHRVPENLATFISVITLSL